MPRLHAFEADTLEAALARVTEEIGRGARIKQAEKVRSGGVAGFFARERYEVTVEVDDDFVPSTSSPTPTPVAPESSEPVSLLDLADAVSQDEREAATAPTSGRRSVPAEPAPTPSTEGQTFQDVLRGIASDAGLFDPPTPETAPAVQEVERPPAVETTDEVAPVLAALGIPEPLIGTSLDGLSVAQRLLGALERLPQPRPVVARRGEVAVVIGPAPVALEAAGQMAAQVGQTADDIVFASLDGGGPSTLRSPDDAQRHAEVWRSCGTPFVVAICPPEGAAGANWLRWMLRSLEPVATWAAVRADRKPEDVARWVDGLGGVDALAVGACAETASPASVLTTGIPVASIDGQRATPLAWTSMLTERLTGALAA